MVKKRRNLARVCSMMLVMLLLAGCGKEDTSGVVDPVVTQTPTAVPTEVPTVEPTAEVTKEPAKVTETPTEAPTAEPTVAPTAEVTKEPAKVTEAPTSAPTEAPTAEPTAVPTAVPTEEPTPEPTEAPTPEPTAVPTAVPTEVPTPEPTAVPTAVPTATPGPGFAISTATAPPITGGTTEEERPNVEDTSCDHDFAEVWIGVPTCTKSGYVSTMCQKCDYVDESRTGNVDALGHAPEGYVFAEGDCVSLTVIRYRCTVCGMDNCAPDSMVPCENPTHDYQTVKRETIDVNTGDMIYTDVVKCMRCGAEKTE